MTDLISELPRHLTVAAAAVTAVAAVVALVWVMVQAVRYVRADASGRRVLRAAWRIKRTWARTARRVGLVQTERSRSRFWSSTPATTVITRELVPPVKVRPERWGMRIDAATLGRLGLRQFQDAADHLADAWKVPQVRVEHARPGVVRLRAQLTDPLTERLAWAAARLHDTDTTRRVLDAVDNAYAERSDGIAEPEWVYWLNRSEIDVMAAHCLIELGTPADAEPLLTRALAGYNHAHAREVALYQTWLAEGYAKTGDLDAARTALDRATDSQAHAGSVRLQRCTAAITNLINRRSGRRGENRPSTT